MKSFNDLLRMLLDMASNHTSHRDKTLTILYNFLYSDTINLQTPSIFSLLTTSAHSSECSKHPDDISIAKNEINVTQYFETTFSSTDWSKSRVEYGYVFTKLKSSINWEEYFAVVDNGCLMLYKDKSETNFTFLYVLYKSRLTKLRMQVKENMEKLVLAIYHKYSCDYLLICPLNQKNNESEELHFEKFIAYLGEIKSIEYPQTIKEIGDHNRNPLSIISLQSININSY